MRKYIKWVAFIGLSLLASDGLAKINVTHNFDNGSLGELMLQQPITFGNSRIEPFEIVWIEAASRTDLPNPVDPDVAPGSRWFNFKIDGIKDIPVFIKLSKTEVNRPFYSNDGVEWFRFEQSENLLPQTVHKMFEGESAYIAYFIPYTHKMHQEDFERWGKSPFVETETIGYSGQGKPIGMLTVTDSSTPYENKKKIWIHSRVHTSEAPASWHLRGFIDNLLGDSPLAEEIRKNAVFYIVPETNPDAVEGGYSRATPGGVNLEINWDRPEDMTVAEVTALKNTIERLTQDRPMDVALNLHSQISPNVTYWIHTEETTSPEFFRKEKLLSALTMAHTPYYNPGDESFSKLNPKYAEGWYWENFGPETLAITFETPYSYYSKNPGGDWVTVENLAELAEASLLSLSDILDLGGNQRIFSDSENIMEPEGWEEINEGKVFFGNSYLSANEKGSKIDFSFPSLEKGNYTVYKWNPGNLHDSEEFPGSNWLEIDKISSSGNDQTVEWRYVAPYAGDVIDAIILVKDDMKGNK